MSLLILQISVVSLVSLACGRLARILGQARVIGEIFGGILIGPSVFGRFAPSLFGRFFPSGSLSSLESLSTVGLILFLFLIGSELDHQHLRQEKASATLTSVTSILLPFGLALLSAPFVYARFSSRGMAKIPFALFLGVSMSITAFPVLARILEEKGLQTQPLGVTALLCAALGDVAAWMLLAVAMTFVSASNGAGLPMRLLWLGIYLAVMFFGSRPAGRWLALRRSRGPLSHELLGVTIAVTFASAAATDAIGVHPLFGAFLAGLCFPRVPAWQQTLRTRLESLLSVVLLPLFFAVTGLRTRLDLLTDPSTWLWTGFILVLATVGKVGGATLGARLTGKDWRFSLALGALLNTRGLVELIVLNIAYSAGVFSQTLFTILVVMALVTTATTVPILSLLRVPAVPLGRGSSGDSAFPRSPGD